MAEPFTWIFRVFFQPISFREFSDNQTYHQRLIASLRLIIPEFLVILISVVPVLVVTLLSGSNIHLVSLIVSLGGGIVLGIVLGIGEGIVFGGTFIICYLIGNWRIPLWPVSAFSIWQVGLRSVEQPDKTLTLLKTSALHWDERIFLPTPGLPSILRRMAANCLREEVLEELIWIIAERPPQAKLARQMLLEILVNELSQRTTFRDIAGAARQIEQVLPEDKSVLPKGSEQAIRLVRDIALDTRSYRNQRGSQARRESLELVEEKLKRMQTSGAISKDYLSQALAGVAGKWLKAVAVERERLREEATETGSLSNPYIPATPLELRRPSSADNLFVGRGDVSRFIEQQLARPDQRTALLLQGQRRMGKTSALKQLPNLLNSRYLPVYFDAQNPAMRGNINGLMAAIADEIYAVMSRHVYRLPRLETAHWNENPRPSASRSADPRGSGEVFAIFDRWLKKAEAVLEKEDRILLLTFDEYEVFDKSFTEGKLDQELLNYFRSLIQHRPRVALLFSGVRHFSENKHDWSHYMVNVKTQVISFLSAEEARLLITQPLPDFPGQEVYADSAVIEEIIQVTGCQPFYVQAVCSALIDQLNSQNRTRADVSDIEIAIDSTLDSFRDYFTDAWRMLSPSEQKLLAGLVEIITSTLLVSDKELGPNIATSKEIITRAGVTEHEGEVALSRLIRREMIRAVDSGKNIGYLFTSKVQTKWAVRGKRGAYERPSEDYEL